MKNQHLSDCAQPLRLIVQGGGETGKTFLIKALQAYLRNEQITTAPTGIACTLTGGQTLHSLFHLQNTKELSSKNVEKLKLILNEVKYIIIDEFSIVGQRTFGNVSDRLCEVFSERCNELFAGRSIILFGDIHQLDPVLDTPLYNSSSNLGKICYDSFDKVAILKINMRQRDDNNYFQILERVKRGNCTSDDYVLLNKQFIYPSSHTLDPEMQYLFAENDACYKHNLKILKLSESSSNPIALITAKGNYKNSKPKNNKMFSKFKDIISVGARVLLTKNLSVKLNLINGSQGVVRHILYYKNSPPLQPDFVMVEFNDYRGPFFQNNLFPIKPYSKAEGDIFSYAIPLRVSYALTVHKSQGLTIPSCIVDLGSKKASIGMTYVAMSRVKRLSDIKFYYFTLNRINSIKETKQYSERMKEEQRLQSLDFIV